MIFRLTIICLVALSCSPTMAQWAVYDKEVFEEIEKINDVASKTIPTLKDLEEPVKLEKLDVDFSKLASLTDADKLKYIGTLQDCGDEKLNAKHFQACAGLRNLRIQTLKQNQSILGVLDKRRESINKVIEDARNNTDQKSGILQRYHFELQGLQAQMQADALKLQILMEGYKQREQVYQMQMAEARRATDTRPPPGSGTLSLGPVEFVKPSVPRR